ncbi:MAG: nitroreductase [Steroidobacteraceae bacterium]
MTTLAALSSRRSIPAQYLTAPGPSEAEINAALELALRAPDHGRLQPWRYRLIRGPARERFAELLVKCALMRDPAAAPPLLDKLRSRPLQAPLVIALSAQLRADPKVPAIEQQLSAAAAAMNVLNAFHLQGFGAIWLTGPSNYDPVVAAALGCSDDEQLLGFMYVGTISAQAPKALARAARAAFVTDWRG